MAASGAEARAVGLQADAKIIVAGTAFASGTANDALAVARYNADGSPDLTFGSTGSVLTDFDTGGTEANTSPVRTAALVIQPDGKLVAVGSVGGHQAAFALARYLPAGALDPKFGAGGKVTTRWQSSAQAYAAAVQPDGYVVVAGGLGATSDSVAFALARYLPTGDLDTTFGSAGLVTTTFDGGGAGAHALIMAADGKLLASGSGYAQSASPRGAVNGGFAVVRYLATGVQDASFGKGGVVVTTVGDAGSMPGALGVQRDGKLVATGLTYFLVPTSSDSPWLVLGFVTVAVLLTTVGIAWMLRSKRVRIGPAPGASRSPR
jgi:uncharacterized delta-60 repeat protein